MEFIETIKIEDGVAFNLEYHNKRYIRTYLKFFGRVPSNSLESYIENAPPKGLFRCRLTYSKEILSIEYIPYNIKRFKEFKIVEADIKYDFKYKNRDKLNRLKEENATYDEVIIKKDGLLTDITIANIAFLDRDNRWITPKKPLLKGIIREKLILQKRILEKDIKSDDLNHFSHFALMNAMIGFQIQNNIIIHINNKEKICL